MATPRFACCCLPAPPSCIDGAQRNAHMREPLQLPPSTFTCSPACSLSHPSRLCVALVVSLAVGICLAAALVLNSEERTPPHFHGLLAFLGFGAAVLWIYVTAEEIVNVILAFGIVFELSHLLLGVTILAVGIGMQDLVTNIGVARSGYANMAAGACVGAPLLNLLLVPSRFLGAPARA